MPCLNHPASPVQSYCQHCGKPLCTSCVRTAPGGQIYCESCLATSGGVADPMGSAWFGATYQGRPVPGFSVPLGGGPNPSAAAVLGLIPGVGAMYNGQLFKGLIHVVVFAVLVSIADRYAIFGLFVAAWIFYQSFEAYHTAKARREGLPVPDPFGLNELGSWLNLNMTGRAPGVPPNPGGPGSVPGTPPPSAPGGGSAAGTAAGTEPPAYTAPYTSSWTAGSATGTAAGQATDPASYPPPGQAGFPSASQASYQTGYPPQPPYTETWAGTQSYPENYPPPGYIPPIPPIPPVPPFPWRRKEPVFAFVLIGLGIVFLLQSMGFVAHLLHYIWPFLLIGMGVWLILRRVSDSQGGSK